MLREILHLLISTIAGLLGSAMLLRAYLVWLRVPRSNPLAVFCAALTDWLVGPLRRILPLRGRYDGASLLAALLIALALVFLVQWGEMSGGINWAFYVPGVLALLVRWALHLMLFVLVVNALLSLINPHAPLAPVFDALTRPILAPIRRFLRPVGGFDLSPMVVIFLVMIGLTVLDQVSL